MPITYFQTLVDHLTSRGSTPTRSDSGDDNGDVKLVDVDAMIRKGRSTGFGAG